MIRVCNVISDKNIGGAGKCLLTFMEHYSKKDIELMIIIPENSLLKEYISALGVKYLEINGLADKSLDFSCISKLLSIFKKIKPDIIHTHAAMSARIAGRLYNKAKIVYTRHSVFEPSKLVSGGIGRRINGFINNFFADRIIAVAEAAKDNLVSVGVNPTKITIIKNGVKPLRKYTSEERNEARLALGINPDVFLIGIAARLTEVKGHKFILKALKRLIDDGLNVRLIIAGCGEFEPQITEQIHSLNISDNVIMPGFTKNIEGFMNILDLNVNASFGTEATSLSIIEGLSIGLPCVASDFGGNPGVISDGVNGMLFKSKDSFDLYIKIKKIISDEKFLNKLKSGALKMYNNDFKAEIMTKKIEEVYYEALEKCKT